MGFRRRNHELHLQLCDPYCKSKHISERQANTSQVNNPDFTRFARRPKDPFWAQLITIPCGFAITCFIGVIVGSASKVIYGTELWSPLDLLSAFLNGKDGEGADSATRAGVFFIAFAFSLAQLGVNIAANVSTSFAHRRETLTDVLSLCLQALT